MPGDRNNVFTAKPQRIIVIGSSGAGKTTLINYVRNQTDLVESNKICIPKRYITRAKRDNDDLVENHHLVEAEFLEFVSENKIDIHWQRDLGGQKKEHYGFEKVDCPGLPVYSANNAIVRPGSLLVPQYLLENSLIIGIYVSDSQRQDRFAERSGDIMKNEAEATIRLKDNAENVFPAANIVIDNSGNPGEVGQSFYRLLEKMTAL